MSMMGGSLSLDTSSASAAVQSLIGSFGNLNNASLGLFAGLSEVGSGLESIGTKTLGAVGSTITAATQIQSQQGRLTASSYNFGQSQQQNQANAAGLTKEILNQAVAIKQPIAQQQTLANSIAQTGARGQDIVALTKNFSEFGQVAGVNADVLAPKFNQLAQQFGIMPSNVKGMQDLTGTMYRLGTTTSGGTAQIVNMTDRVAGLSAVANISEKSFLGIAAAAGNVDSRIRGGGVGAIQAFTEKFGLAQSDPILTSSQNLFRFLGTSAQGFADTMNAPDGATHTITNFLNQFNKLTPASRQTELKNLGITAPAQTIGIGEFAKSQSTGKGIDYYNQMAQQDNSGAVGKAYDASYTDTAAAKMTAFDNQIKLLKKSIGQDLLPVMTTLAGGFGTIASAVGSIPGPILAGAAALATLAAIMVKVVGMGTKVVATAGVIKGGLQKIGVIKTPDTVAGNAAKEGATGGVAANTAALEANTAAIKANSEAAAAMAGSSMDEGAAFAEESLAIGAQTEELNLLASAKEKVAAAGMADALTGAGGAAGATENVVATGAATEGAVGGMSAGAGLTAALAPVAIGAVAVAAGFSLLSQASGNLQTSMTASAANTNKQFDTSTLGGIRSAISKDNSEVQHYSKDEGQGQKGVGGFLSRGLEQIASLSGVSSANKDADANKAYKQQITDLTTQLNAAKAVADKLFGGGYTDAQLNQVLKAAADNAINLANGGKQAQDSLQSLLSKSGSGGGGGPPGSGGTQGVDTGGTGTVADQQEQDTKAQSASEIPQDSQAVTAGLTSEAAASIKVGEAQRALANYSSDVAEAQNQVAEAVTGVASAALSEQQAAITLGTAQIALANYGATLAEDQNKVAEAFTQEASSALDVTAAQIQQQQATQALDNFSQTLAEDQNKVAEANLQVAQSSLSLIQVNLTASEAAQEQALGVASAQLSEQQSYLGTIQATNQYNDAQWALQKLNGPDWAIQQAQANNSVKDTTLSLTQATLSQQNAQWQLTQLQEEHASSRDIQVAQLNLEMATQKVTDTTTGLKAAQQQVNELPTNHNLAVADATNQLNQAQLATQTSTINLTQAQIALYNADVLAANNVGVLTAQQSLSAANLKVQDSTYGIVQAQAALNTVMNGSIQLAYNQATLAVTSAEQKQQDAAYGVTQAQAALNILQLGGTQLAYKQAVLGVTQSQQHYTDAVNQVRQAQLALNNLQDGSMQNQLKQAQNALTASQLSEVQAQQQLWVATKQANGPQLTAQQQAQHLAQLLEASGNPQLVAMGQNMGSIAQVAPSAAQGVAGVGEAAQSMSAQVQQGANELQNIGFTAQQAQQEMQILANTMVQVGNGTSITQLQNNLNRQAQGYAKGGFITSPELAFVGEGGSPELILPLNDPARMYELLQQAGLMTSSGDLAAYGAPVNVGSGQGATASQPHVTKINQFNLEAITQPAPPDEVMNAFAWGARLVA